MAEVNNNIVDISGNENILRHIFNYCNVKDQKSFRLVSKPWYEATLKGWRWRPTNILSICDCENGCRKEGKHGLSECNAKLSLEDFLGHLKNSPFLQLENVPYRNYRLKEWDFSQDNSPTMEEFFEKVGSRFEVERVEAFRCTIGENVAFTNNFYRQLPRMESLTIRENNWIRLEEEINERHTFPCISLRRIELRGAEFDKACFLDLFRHCPDLEELIIDDDLWTHNGKKKRSPSETLSDVMEAIVAIRKESENHRLGIKILDLMQSEKSAIRCKDSKNPTTLSLFKEANLPLTKLTIDFGEMATQDEVQLVLSSHAATLEILEAFRYPAAPAISPWAGLTMNSLKELTLWGAFIQNFDFLKQMPNLTKMRIYFRAQLKNVVVLNPSVTLAKVIKNTNSLWTKKTWFLGKVLGNKSHAVGKNVKWFETDVDVKLKDITKLLEWMPNITTIRVPMTNDDMEKLKKTKPNLNIIV